MAHEKAETLRQRVSHKQRIPSRLRLVATRLTDARLERICAIVSAREQDLLSAKSPRPPASVLPASINCFPLLMPAIFLNG